MRSQKLVNLESMFEIRGLVMKYVPKFMRGVFRGAIKTSLQAKRSWMETRGWKLLMLIPQIALHPATTEGSSPGRTSEGESGQVQRGRMGAPLGVVVGVFHARQCCKKSTQEGNGCVPCSKGSGGGSSGSTQWKVFTDEVKRPQTAREGVDQELMVEPYNPCGFGCGSLVEEFEDFPRCSGRPFLTTKHLKILLDSTECFVWRGGDVVQALTSLDKGATILSMDGVGACDTGSSVARGDRHGSWGQDDPLRPAILFFSVHIFVGRRGGGDKKDSAG